VRSRNSRGTGSGHAAVNPIKLIGRKGNKPRDETQRRRRSAVGPPGGITSCTAALLNARAGRPLYKFAQCAYVRRISLPGRGTRDHAYLPYAIVLFDDRTCGERFRHVRGQFFDKNKKKKNETASETRKRWSYFV